MKGGDGLSSLSSRSSGGGIAKSDSFEMNGVGSRNHLNGNGNTKPPAQENPWDGLVGGISHRSCTTVARNENVIFVKRVKLHFSELNWEHCWEVWRLVFEEAAKVLRLGRSLPTYHKWCIHFYCFNRLLLLLLLVAIIIIGEAKNSFSLKLISEIHSLLK